MGTRDLVRLITAEQSALIADARHTVQALSLVAHPDEVDQPDCEARFGQFAQQDPRFVYVAVADTRGELLCAVDRGTDPQMRARMLGSARAAAASGADSLNRGISFLQKPFAGPVLLRAVRGALEAGAA